MTRTHDDHRQLLRFARAKHDRAVYGRELAMKAAVRAGLSIAETARIVGLARRTVTRAVTGNPKAL